jgi:hypothetical protein
MFTLSRVVHGSADGGSLFWRRHLHTYPPPKFLILGPYQRSSRSTAATNIQILLAKLTVNRYSVCVAVTCGATNTRERAPRNAS